MTEPSCATLATFRIDLNFEAEQRVGLEKMIVPGVQRHPGFVSGVWALDRASSTSHVMLTFETRDAAEAMRENVMENAANQRAAGLELISIDVLEISASALATSLPE